MNNMNNMNDVNGRDNAATRPAILQLPQLCLAAAHRKSNGSARHLRGALSGPSITALMPV